MERGRGRGGSFRGDTQTRGGRGGGRGEGRGERRDSQDFSRGRGGRGEGRGERRDSQEFSRGRGGGRGESGHFRGGGRGMVDEIAPKNVSLLQTNFYSTRIKRIQVYSYRLDFTNPKVEDSKITQNLSRVTEEALRKHFQTWFVYDTKHILYFAQPPFKEQQKTVALDLVGKERKQEVLLRKEKEFFIENFSLIPEALQFLQLFIKSHLVTENSIVRGKTVYDRKTLQKLGDRGFGIVRGLAAAFHLCNAKILINVDIKNAIFMDDLPFEKWLSLKAQEYKFSNFIEALSDDRAYSKIVKELKNRKVVLLHLKGKRKKTINDLIRTPPSKQTFEIVNEKGKKETISVAQYFLKNYGKLQNPDKWPLVQVIRNDQKEFYPIDVCVLLGNQKNQPNNNEKALAIKMTIRSLSERFADINEQLSKLDGNTRKDSFMEFSIDSNPIVTEGRILIPPKILYRNNVFKIPQNGEWSLHDVKFHTPSQTLKEMLILYPPSLSKESAINFENNLISFSKDRGFLQYKISYRPYDTRDTNLPIRQEDKSKFILLVLEDNSDSYAAYKTQIELNFGCKSQFVKVKNIISAKPALINNILLAINAKDKGFNSTLEQITTRKTTFVGIDVHHPPPGSSRPSQAAISASLNPQATSYYSTFRSQNKGQENISALKEMLSEVFSLKELSGIESVVVIRDGIADTQFSTYGDDEIQDFLQVMKEKFQTRPKLTYIVAQKRNMCRLAAKEGEKLYAPIPGTVLDHTITDHPNNQDFYLVSYSSPKGVGSAKPIHFWVYSDDLKLDVKEWESIMYKLSHLHPGCTRSVSLPLPLYNAHKIAFRIGQVYQPILDSDDSSSSSSSDSGKTKTILLDSSLKSTPFFF